MFSRRGVGWSIADHLRTELVVDALDMARWPRKPTSGQTVLHSDRSSQDTWCPFGGGLREARADLDWPGMETQCHTRTVAFVPMPVALRRLIPLAAKSPRDDRASMLSRSHDMKFAIDFTTKPGTLSRRDETCRGWVTVVGGNWRQISVTRSILAEPRSADTYAEM